MTPLSHAQAFGAGEVEVDHAYGGTNALRVVSPGGVGIAAASIECFTATDYSSGHRAGEYAIATTHTGSDGRWATPFMLSPGEYTLRVYRAGTYAPKAVELVVV